MRTDWWAGAGGGWCTGGCSIAAQIDGYGFGGWMGTGGREGRGHGMRKGQGDRMGWGVGTGLPAGAGGG